MTSQPQSPPHAHDFKYRAETFENGLYKLVYQCECGEQELRDPQSPPAPDLYICRSCHAKNSATHNAPLCEPCYMRLFVEPPTSPPAGDLERLLLRWRYDDLQDKTGAEMEQLVNAYILAEVKESFKTFFDTFESEIDQQEFALDEAEWLSLIQVMRISEAAAQARFSAEGGNHNVHG